MCVKYSVWCMVINECQLMSMIISSILSLSHVRLFATPWTVTHQALLSVGFPRQKYWTGLPCPPPGDLPDLGIESSSPASPDLEDGFFTTEPLGKSGLLSAYYQQNLRHILWWCISVTLQGTSLRSHCIRISAAFLLVQWRRVLSNTSYIWLLRL